MPGSADAPPASSASVRRSATLPSRFVSQQLQAQPQQQTSADPAEPFKEHFLFYHRSVKIVHFAPRAVAPVPPVSSAPCDFDYPVDTVETLPWRSPTEHTVALAPLSLEKVHGVVVFLKCKPVVRPILKNSQCWCVDGEATFVLRIQPLTYYRIELPNATDEDKKLVAQFKAVLSGVLRYEVTPCPFKRGFSVDIPEDAMAPKRKRAWRPKERRESAPVDSTALAFDESVSSHGPVSDDGSKECRRLATATATDTDTDMGLKRTGRHTADDAGSVSEMPQASLGETSQDEADAEPRMDQQQSSLTESLDNSASRDAIEEEDNEFDCVVDADAAPSFSSSVESFHSVLPSSSSVQAVSSPASSLATDFPPADEHERLESRQPRAGGRVVSEVPDPASAKEYFEHQENSSYLLVPAPATASPRTRGQDGASNLAVPTASGPAQPLQPAAMADYEAVPPSGEIAAGIRRRLRASRSREISPMPPPSTLYLPRPDSNPLSVSFLRKTCTLVLVPPIQLFMVLIHIAARIVIGPELSYRLEQDSSCVQRRQEEDDFGIPLGRESSFGSSDTRDCSQVEQRDGR